jgi:hypothetical protein
MRSFYIKSRNFNKSLYYINIYLVLFSDFKLISWWIEPVQSISVNQPNKKFFRNNIFVNRFCRLNQLPYFRENFI